jgi:hypothetical protein
VCLCVSHTFSLCGSTWKSMLTGGEGSWRSETKGAFYIPLVSFSCLFCSPGSSLFGNQICITGYREDGIRLPGSYRREMQKLN